MTELTKATLEQTADSLREIVAKGELRQGKPSDEVCGIVPELYVEPANETELSHVLEYANQTRLQVAPRGGGTKLDWGNAPQSVDLMVSTTTLSRILEHAPGDMTVAVEAGVTIAQLQNALAQHGQKLALDPMWPDRATVGGVIAANDSGSLRLRYGSVRDLIIGITVALGDGTIAKSGGKVVKNVAGYDLPKLMSGAFGTLGVITRAVFRLHPIPKESQTVTFPFPSYESANSFILSIADSILVPTGLQMRTGSAGRIEVDVRMDGIAAGIAAGFETVCKLAGNISHTETGDDPWRAREELWGSSSATIFKLSTLPSRLSSTASFVRKALGENSNWTLLMYSTGLAWLRIDDAEAEEMAKFLSSIRALLAPTDGTAVLLKASAALRQKVDIWGDCSSLPLMKRVKEQFDPRRILNRGRFVGGI
jgi:glycolate oxidase FAD binding subunit